MDRGREEERREIWGRERDGEREGEKEGGRRKATLDTQ